MNRFERMYWDLEAKLAALTRRVGKKKTAKRAKPAKRRTVSTARKSTARKAPKKKGAGRNEARAWLAKNKNPQGFAPNKFGELSSNNAMGLVRRLYDAGAVRVDVANVLREPWRIKEEGGPLADVLMVTLPKNAAKVEAVEALARSYEPDEMGRRGGKLRLWWD